MNANEAKSKCNALSHKYPDTTRKAWEARKAFAKECGIDVKVFDKGLGPQYDRWVGVLRGVKEIDAYDPVDERSIKSLRSERPKLDQIITAYLAIPTPKLKPVKHEPQWYGWWSLNNGLESLQRWGKDGIRQIDADLKERTQAAGEAITAETPPRQQAVSGHTELGAPHHAAHLASWVGWDGRGNAAGGPHRERLPRCLGCGLATSPRHRTR